MSSKFRFYLTLLFAVSLCFIHKSFDDTRSELPTPGIIRFLLNCCFRQCHRLRLPIPILLGIVHTLIQIDIAHIFVVDVDLLAFIAVFVDHLFVHYDFFDELIEYVGIQLLYIGVFADVLLRQGGRRTSLPQSAGRKQLIR